MALIKDLAIERTLLELLSDQFYDERGNLVLGRNHFNTILSDNYPHLPLCTLFSGGSQSLADGSVRMFVNRTSISGGQYGANFTNEATYSVDISLMLPSGSFNQDAWDQSIGYANSLVYAVEVASSDCLLNAVTLDWNLNYYTQSSDGSFDVFEAVNKVENKKIVLSLSLKQVFMGGL